MPRVFTTLSFCARPSPDSGLAIPSHAFVSWSQVPAAGKRGYKAVGTVSGLQPKALVGFSRSITPVPMELTQGDYVSLVERCLNLLVSKTDYQRALKLGQSSLAQIASTIPSQSVSAVYSLPPEDCLTMFVEVMKLFGNKGIALPPRRPSEMPLAYMRRLVEQNATARGPQ